MRANEDDLMIGKLGIPRAVVCLLSVTCLLWVTALLFLFRIINIFDAILMKFPGPIVVFGAMALIVLGVLLQKRMRSRRRK